MPQTHVWRPEIGLSSADGFGSVPHRSGQQQKRRAAAAQLAEQVTASTETGRHLDSE
jgi:hypothetical protein